MTASDRCSDVKPADTREFETDGLLTTTVRLVCVSRSYSPRFECNWIEVSTDCLVQDRTGVKVAG
jgi:hypothetical protein